MKVRLTTIIFLFALIFFACTRASFAQADSAKAQINNILERLKTAFELEKLNDIRIRLRNIEFASLKTKETKELYAEAYRQLAYAHKNHRYIRPAYDIFQKYIALRDNIMNEEKVKIVAETNRKYDGMLSELSAKISDAEKEKNALTADKAELSGLKRNNLTYRIICTMCLTALFLLYFTRLRRKTHNSNKLLSKNREKILSLNNAVTKGQMTIGSFNRLKIINNNIAAGLANMHAHVTAIQGEGADSPESLQKIQLLKQAAENMAKQSENANKHLHALVN